MVICMLHLQWYMYVTANGIYKRLQSTVFMYFYVFLSIFDIDFYNEMYIDLLI